MNEIPLLRIGEFSRAASLSVKALRSYHEAGLLVPAVVDPVTGYRSYSVAQLTDAAVIRRLRELDVPLEAIRAVLDARDPDVTGKVLSEHSAVLEERVAAMRRAIDEIYVALETPELHTPVHIRPAPAQTVLTLTATVNGDGWLPFLERARAALYAAAAGSGAATEGPFGGCYPTLVDDDAQDVIAFLPVAGAGLLPAEHRAAGVRVDELPGGPLAVLAHRGSYDGLSDTYQQLGAWVAANAQPRDLPVRELYLIGPADTEDTNRWRTEVCWPVRAEEDGR